MTDLEEHFSLKKVSELKQNLAQIITFVCSTGVLLQELGETECNEIQITLTPSQAHIIGHVLNETSKMSLAQFFTPLREYNDDATQPDVPESGDGTSEPDC